MEAFGALVKFLVAMDDLPFRVDAEITHERHELIEDFGYAPAQSGRVHLDHLHALQLAGKLAQVIYNVFTRYFCIKVEIGYHFLTLRKDIAEQLRQLFTQFEQAREKGINQGDLVAYLIVLLSAAFEPSSKIIDPVRSPAPCIYEVIKDAAD
jgi:hypothetical protein